MFKSLFKKDTSKDETIETLNLTIRQKNDEIHALRTENKRLEMKIAFVPKAISDEMRTDTKSHKKAILEHLKLRGSITGAQAWDLYRCQHLPSSIKRLRRDGHKIETEMIKKKDYSFAKYKFVGFGNGVLAQ